MSIEEKVAKETIGRLRDANFVCCLGDQAIVRMCEQAADLIESLLVQKKNLSIMQHRCAEAASKAKLPEGYQWGEDAMEQFNFGKERAADAIRALRPHKVSKNRNAAPEIIQEPTEKERFEKFLKTLEDPKVAKAFLMETGILDKEGNPSPNYYTPSQIAKWRSKHGRR